MMSTVFAVRYLDLNRTFKTSKTHNPDQTKISMGMLGSQYLLLNRPSKILIIICSVFTLRSMVLCTSG